MAATPDMGPRQSAGHGIKVAVHPWAWRNPYQDLLYGALEQMGDSWIRLADFPHAGRNPLGALRQARRAGVDVIHFHWPVFGPESFPFWIQHVRLLWALHWTWALRVSGLPVVWTVHNVRPHEPRTSGEGLVYRQLSDLASALIVHSTSAIDEMTESGLSTKNVHVVPHGSYRDAYPPPRPRAEARKLLGWPDSPTAVFVGGVAPYKGLDRLVEAFDTLPPGEARLVIAGDCLVPDLDKSLRNAASTAIDLTYENRVLSDEELSLYVSASSAVCLPYTRTTTSGTALLALSMYRPIVAPRIGSLRDLPDGVGVFYDPVDANGLKRALLSALSAEPKGFHSATRAYLETIDWRTIAQATHLVYESVLASR